MMRGSLRWATLAAVCILCTVAFALPGSDAGAQQAPTTVTIINAPVPLTRGCNVFVVQAPVGTPWSSIVGRVANPGSVLGMWRFDNQRLRYQGLYFNNSAAPTDPPASTIITPPQAFSVWLCVDADTVVS